MSLCDIEFFHGIDTDTLQKLEQHMARLVLPAGRALFNEGDDSESLYVVVSGRLEIRLTNQPGNSPLAHIGAGEVVGELGVLTGEPRSASVWTVRDTELIMLASEAFQRLMEESPRSIATLSRAIACRFISERTGNRKPQSKISTVCIMPLSSDLPIKQCRDIISQSYQRIGNQLTIESEHSSQTSDWFHQQEELYDNLLYVADPEFSSWTKLCVRQSDLILLVAEPDDPEPDPELIAYLNKFAAGRICQFVLLQPEHNILPKTGQRWMDKVRARSRWNLSLASENGRDRLVRIVTGRTVGVVLSGGGARGFAHLGVIKALRENGIPIDHIAGTSMGALMAAGLAMGWSFEEFRKRLHKTFIDINPVGDLTIPLHSLARGRRLSRLLHENFGQTEARSMWLPFYCTASDLTQGNIARLDSGPTWRAVRASLSIPGLVPPVLKDGNVLVDGGLINNMPIDAMDKVNIGPVIGVDVGHDEGSFRLDAKVCDVGNEGFLPSFSSPSIVGVLMRSATVAGENNNRGAEQAADLVLYPDVKGVSILNWHALDEMIERGYSHANSPEILAKLKSLCVASDGY